MSSSSFRMVAIVLRLGFSSFAALVVAGFIALGLMAVTGGFERLAEAAPASGPAVVDIAFPNFTPQVVTVTAGAGGVRWNNNNFFTHTSTSDSAVWNSGSIAGGGSFTFTFDLPGVFPYHCAIHPIMTGTVVVLPPPNTVCASGCAFGAIQPAIDAAAPGDTIKVAAGTYTESLAITKSLVLLGGYAGMPFTNRVPSLYTTRILGNDLQSAVAMTDPVHVPISVTIDGFSIENGRGTTSGGGVRAIQALLTLRNDIIANNHVTATDTMSNAYGAGVYVEGGSLWVASSTFNNNQNYCPESNCPVETGGGIFVTGTTAFITGSLFTSNYAWVGAGIGSINTALTVANSIFRGGSGAYGVGVHADGSGFTVIASNRFSGQNAGSTGAAFNLYGTDDAIVSGHVISGLAAYDVAVAVVNRPVVTLTNNMIVNNRATTPFYPRIMDVGGKSGLFVNNTFANNLVFTPTAPALLLSANGSGYTLANNIFFSETTALTLTAGTAFLTHNAFSTNGQNWSGAGVIIGPGNITVTNLGFVNVPGNYHLRFDSPLRHMGDSAYNPLVDFEGEPRGNPPDIGADEFTGRLLFLPLVLR